MDADRRASSAEKTDGETSNRANRTNLIFSRKKAQEAQKEEGGNEESRNFRKENDRVLFLKFLPSLFQFRDSRDSPDSRFSIRCVLPI
jgi:hypothetical protein